MHLPLSFFSPTPAPAPTATTTTTTVLVATGCISLVIVVVVLAVRSISRAWKHVRPLSACVVRRRVARLKSPQLSVQLVGSAGCGKSTLATQLAGRKSLAYVRLDDYKSRLPRWKDAERDAFERLVRTACRDGGFVLDGNYHSLCGGTENLTRDIALVIWLDFSFAVYAPRLIKRSLTNIRVKYGIASLLLLVPLVPLVLPVAAYLLVQQWFTNWTRKRTYSRDLKRYLLSGDSPECDQMVVVFRTPAEAERYLHQAVAELTAAS